MKTLPMIVTVAVTVLILAAASNQVAAQQPIRVILDCSSIQLPAGLTCDEYIKQVFDNFCKNESNANSPLCAGNITVSDHNECAVRRNTIHGHNCSEGANCINRNPGFDCVCKDGFTDDNEELPGRNCTDIDECLTECITSRTTCENTPGGFNCTCNPGFEGDATAGCTDVNECRSNPCNSLANCSNTVGSYICNCPEFYQYDYEKNECVDINECMLPVVPCSINETFCSNREPGFICFCRDFQNSGCGGTCADNHTCMNNTACKDLSFGGHTCICLPGYIHGENDTKNCVDINECNNPTLNTCSSNANCSNTDGSFSCACNAGYEGDGKICEDIHECNSSTLNTCSPNARCINSIGSFSCTCKPGFDGDGKSCEDVNECNSDPCTDGKVCKNNPGSFACVPAPDQLTLTLKISQAFTRDLDNQTSSKFVALKNKIVNVVTSALSKIGITSVSIENVTFSDGGDCQTYFTGSILFTSSLVTSSNDLEQGLAKELRQQTCVTFTSVSVTGCLDGSNPVNCLINPCDTSTCASDPSAVCVPNYCGGCQAEFFHRGRRVNCSAVNPRCSSLNNTNVGPCIHGCSDSRNCSTGKICCSNGCGTVCVKDPEPCAISCHVFGECITNETSEVSACKCRDGFFGDGVVSCEFLFLPPPPSIPPPPPENFDDEELLLIPPPPALPPPPPFTDDVTEEFLIPPPPVLPPPPPFTGDVTEEFLIPPPPVLPPPPPFTDDVTEEFFIPPPPVLPPPPPFTNAVTEELIIPPPPVLPPPPPGFAEERGNIKENMGSVCIITSMGCNT